MWVKYDPKGTHVTPSYNLAAIVQQLKPPLGTLGREPPPTRTELLRLLQRLNVPDRDGCIHFHETLTAMSAAEVGCAVPDCDSARALQRKAVALPELRRLEKARHSTHTTYVITLLQTRARNFLTRAGVVDLMADQVQTAKAADDAAAASAGADAENDANGPPMALTFALTDDELAPGKEPVATAMGEVRVQHVRVRDYAKRWKGALRKF